MELAASYPALRASYPAFRASYPAPHAQHLSPTPLSRILVLHSVDLFSHLVEKDNLVWDAWVKHVNYCKHMYKKSYTMSEILAFDKAVYEAMVAFQKVKGYKNFFKPKQHFTAHAAINTLRMGPMRGCAYS